MKNIIFSGSGALRPPLLPLQQPPLPGLRRRTRAESRTRRQLQTRESWNGYLRRRTVTAMTRLRYERAVKSFNRFCSRQGLTVQVQHETDLTENHVAQVDKALDKYLVQIYRDGGPVQKAREAACGVAWMVGRRLASLPLAKQSLMGFNKESPSTSREPLTWPEVVIMSDWMLSAQKSSTTSDRRFWTSLCIAVLVHYDL